MPGCKGYEMGAVLAATYTNVLVWRDVFIREVEIVHISESELSEVLVMCRTLVLCNVGVQRVYYGVLCTLCIGSGLVRAIAQPTYIPMALHILKAYIIILNIQQSHDGTQDTNRTYGIFTVIQP